MCNVNIYCGSRFTVKLDILMCQVMLSIYTYRRLSTDTTKSDLIGALFVSKTETYIRCQP